MTHPRCENPDGCSRPAIDDGVPLCGPCRTLMLGVWRNATEWAAQARVIRDRVNLAGLDEDLKQDLVDYFADEVERGPDGQLTLPAAVDAELRRVVERARASRGQPERAKGGTSTAL